MEGGGYGQGADLGTITTHNYGPHAECQPRGQEEGLRPMKNLKGPCGIDERERIREGGMGAAAAGWTCSCALRRQAGRHANQELHA